MSTETFRREWLRLRARQWVAAGAVAALPLLGSAALAAEEVDELEEVVVTGSSIKGAAPVGSAIVTVGRENLEEIGAQTVQQVLKTVPAVVGMNSAGQGSYGSFDGAGTNAPTIHGLGASASNSTLILINGHRLPLTGLNHTLADPNILAPAALERVEVLADGASSVYGSDAVAGVINFITRRKYDGAEFSVQKGFGDAYDTFSASMVAGKRWDDGSALVSYAYSDRSSLSAGDRDFTRADHRAQGGGNFASFACSPATVSPAGQALIFYAPYSSGVANSSANASCDYSGLTDLIPQERRHSLFVSLEQSLNDRLDVSGDFIYSRRDNRQDVARGNVQATVSQAVYPFFQVPAGSAATSATVRFQADDLLGPGAHIDSRAETFYASLKANYQLSESWDAEVGTVLGRDSAFQKNYGQLCVSCAYLALTGTTSGSTQATTPLTAATALDVFNTGAANRTSAAVRADLVDNFQTRIGDQTIANYWVTLNGSLFALPGGDAKAAVGAEYIRYTLKQDNTIPTNTGPVSKGGARHETLNYGRDVKSAYAEVLLPFVSPDMGVTGIRKLEANVSGRIDDYSDFGQTSNPKLAANWEVTEGFQFRANWGKSFVAPALTSRGNAQGITGESGFGGYGLGQVNVPVANFPNAVGLPGCVAGAVTCVIGNSTVTGAQITGGNGNLKPQTGESWGVGFDWRPSVVEGLSLSATYWNNELKGGITAPVPSLALNTAALSNLLQIFPAGATPAQLAAARGSLPASGALPPTVYFIYNYQQNNILNLDIAGVDVDLRYVVDSDFGKWNFGAGATRKVKFDQSIGSGGQVFSVLGTAGFNTTFPSLKLEGRANVGWEMGPLSADLFFNYVGSYRNWSGGTISPVVRVNNVPASGGDKVDAMKIVDLNLNYKLSGKLEGTQLFLDATNLFDEDPPFYNNANGYDGINASPIGRVVTIGVRTKL
ncbi:MAG: hypothetical protein RL026_2448 [Pseudomonadota bacterium]